MAVLHRRIGLGPRLGGLTHLERRLVREPDGPAAAEEGELLGGDQLGVQRLGDGATGVGHGRVEILAERCAQERERGGGEAGLHDRSLVGERQHHDVIDQSSRPAMSDRRRCRRWAPDRADAP